MKLKKSEIANYLFYGVITTLVNIITFKVMILFGCNYIISNIIAFISSIVFAYITNKRYVFKRSTTDVKQNIMMSFKFFLSRLLTFGIDMLSMYILIEIISIEELTSKIITNIIVIILNYGFSKIFVFNIKKEAK